MWLVTGGVAASHGWPFTAEAGLRIDAMRGPFFYDGGMTLHITHRVDEHVDIDRDGRPLARYVYRSAVAADESPKPYLHPLRTLGGEVVTGFRPHDHRWHTGVAMTCAELSGQNFWGGPTYVRDKGYQRLDNAGQQRHVEWLAMRCDADEALLEHGLAWTTAAGETWIDERRAITIGDVDAAQGWYRLTFRMALRNVHREALVFGSPTTQGRENAGYGSLFWRGPRSFEGGKIVAADGGEGEAMRGQRSPWLAFVGQHDERDALSTIVFVDSPSNVRHPTKWFVRSRPTPVVSFAFMFDEELELGPGQSLTLRYHMLIADGAWDAARIGERVAELVKREERVEAR